MFLKFKLLEKEIVLDTTALISYYETDDDCVMVENINGGLYKLNVTLIVFEKILSTVIISKNLKDHPMYQYLKMNLIKSQNNNDKLERNKQANL